MANKVVHERSLRLYNNAGISFPVCRLPLNGEPLDLDATRYNVSVYDPTTCKHCLKRIASNPWIGSGKIKQS